MCGFVPAIAQRPGYQSFSYKTPELRTIVMGSMPHHHHVNHHIIIIIK
jgi:hypothetical protein